MNVKEMREVLDIFERNGVEFLIEGAGHDEVWFAASDMSIKPKSRDGERLDKLGLHFNDEYGCWTLFC